MAKFSGGTRVDSSGYLVIKAGPHRDVRVATLVLEAKLGRKLRKDEDVHHVNGLKLDMGECGSNLVALGHRDHGAVSNRQRIFLAQREARLKRQYEEQLGPGSTATAAEEDTTFNPADLNML